MARPQLQMPDVSIVAKMLQRVYNATEILVTSIWQL